MHFAGHTPDYKGETALAPGSMPHGFSPGPGPDSQATRGARRPGGSSPPDPVHSGKHENDTVGGHRGHCPAPSGIGTEPTRRDRTKGPPRHSGPQGGGQAHLRAGPGRDTALPPGVPSGTPPVADTTCTVPSILERAAVSRPPDDTVRGRGCRHIPLPGPPTPWSPSRLGRERSASPAHAGRVRGYPAGSSGCPALWSDVRSLPSWLSAGGHAGLPAANREWPAPSSLPPYSDGPVVRAESRECRESVPLTPGLCDDDTAAACSAIRTGRPL